MTIKYHNFDFLDEFKKQGQDRAAKVEDYQKVLDEAKSRLTELTTMYELTFTQAIQKGKDATTKLQQIDDDIALQKEVVARRERDLQLAIAAAPTGEISSVDVERKYSLEFAPKVAAEFTDVVNPKLKLARDLLLSCIDDHREGQDNYDWLREEMNEMSRTNRYTGKTREIYAIMHPTTDTRCMGRPGGAMNGVREVLDQVAKYTHGIKPHDYKYVEQAPKLTEKDGK